MDGESQAQRDARLRSLWEKLDTKRKGTLDYEALKRGLVAVNHRMLYRGIGKGVRADGNSQHSKMQTDSSRTC